MPESQNPQPPPNPLPKEFTTAVPDAIERQTRPVTDVAEALAWQRNNDAFLMECRERARRGKP